MLNSNVNVDRINNLEYLFICIGSFLLFINASISLSAQCPISSECIDDEKYYLIDLSTQVSECGSGSFSHAIQAKKDKCQEQDANPLNCVEYHFTRPANSPIQQFNLRIGQGNSCNGELDASYVLYESGQCQQLSSGGSQTAVTFTFPYGEDAMSLFLCVNSSGQTSICDLCVPTPPCNPIAACRNLDDIEGCVTSTCDIPAAESDISTVFDVSGCGSTVLSMSSVDEGETNCIDSNNDGVITITRWYTLYFEDDNNNIQELKKCSQNIVLDDFNMVCDLNNFIGTFDCNTGIPIFPTTAQELMAEPYNCHITGADCGVVFGLIATDDIAYQGCSSASINRSVTVYRDANGNGSHDLGEESSTCTYNYAMSSSILSVELETFKGYVENSDTKLEWKTASEYENSHFNIERSIDGLLWTKIGEVEGSGNARYANEYTFIDRRIGLNNDKVYYRLNQVNFDKTSTYSYAISVVHKNTLKSISVFPNPTKESFAIEGVDYEDYYIEVYDIFGKMITSTSSNQVDVVGYKKGTYIVRVFNHKEEAITTRKVVVF